MSDLENPYQSPQAEVVPEASQSTGVSMTETILKYLYESSPWLRFVGILGYIGSAMLCLLGIIFAVGGMALQNFMDDFGQFPAALIGLIYVPMGVLFFFPSHFTFTFGKKINSYKFSNSIEDMEDAFKNNKSLWKFYGILCIVYLAFIPLVIIVSVIVGVASAVGGGFNY